jgi:hypothetical protein
MFLALSSLCLLAHSSVLSTPRALEVNVELGQAQDPKAEFDQRMKDASGSVEKLWKVYEWCQTSSLDSQGRQVLRAILKIDDQDKKAHELLGEVEYEGKWYANEKKVEELKKKKLEDEAKKSGKAVFNGELVDPADLPFLQRGMKRFKGEWVSADDYQKLNDGWVRQDLELVSPDEAPNIAKGLWKCGTQWLSLADANKYHAEFAQRWRIPTPHFVLHTTCSREIANNALGECEQAFKSVDRVFARTPSMPVAVVLLSSLDQYNKFANGELGDRVELTGFSSLHGGFFAEIWPEALKQGQNGAGVACWDAADNNQQQWAPMFVRYAAAHALIEAIDPSPKTMEGLMSGAPGKDPVQAYWNEKEIPLWLRYGTAAYADSMLVLPKDNDPERLRKFAVGHYIANRGGFDALDKVFDLSPTLDDQPGSEKRIFEAGLVVAFMVDGKCAPVIDKLMAFRDAFKGGKDVKKAAKALEDVIQKNEPALHKFAGL